MKNLLLSFDIVADSNYLSSHADCHYFENRKPWRRSLFISELGHLFLTLGAYLTVGNQPARWRLPKNQLAFFVLSKNNSDSVRPVQRLLDGESYFLAANRFVPGYLLPAAPIALISILCIPMALVRILVSKGHDRKALLGSFRNYVLAYGWYYWTLLYLSRRRPVGIVFANDHVMKARIVRLVCSRLGIPTFFLPHSVQDRNCIPPLDFDYAYLYGEYASSQYERSGVRSRAVYEVGIPKFDDYVDHVKDDLDIRAVGVCTNRLTPEQSVSPVLNLLRNDFPNLTVVIRPHPSDKRPLFRRLAREYGYEYSDSPEQEAFDFLVGVDAIIAGDTGILLEATLINVAAIYFGQLGVAGDMFGFIENGIASVAHDAEELRRILLGLNGRKVNFREKAKRYVASVGTDFDGKSAEVVALLIKENLEEFYGATR